MIRGLVLKNFKVHQHLELQFADITILIGPEGTGKSTILDALYLLAHSAKQQELSFRGGRLEGLQFRDIVHRRDEKNLLELRLKCEFVGAYPPITNGPSHTLEYALVVDSAGVREHSASYSFPDGLRWEFRTPRMGRGTVPPSLQLEGRPRVEFRKSTLICLPFVFELQGRDYPFHRSLVQLREEIVNYLRQFHLVRTDRELTSSEQKIYERAEAPFSSAADVVNWLAQNWEDKDTVSKWTEQVVRRRIEVRRAGDGFVVEAADGAGGPHPIINEGSGLRQLLWPLTALAAAEPGSLVAIEEPEIHLHPAAQGRLCDLLCEVVREQGKRVLLTTHSEHIVMAFLTAVARGRLASENLALYSFSSDENGGVRSEALSVDERGMVAGGLKGFFEASLDELASYLSALASSEGS